MGDREEEGGIFMTFKAKKEKLLGKPCFLAAAGARNRSLHSGLFLFP